MGRRIESPAPASNDPGGLRRRRRFAQRVLLGNISVESPLLQRHYVRLHKSRGDVDRLKGYEKTLEEIGAIGVYEAGVDAYLERVNG